MPAQEVIVRLRAVGARAFKTDMDRSAGAVKNVGDESKKAARASRASGRLMAAGAGAAVVASKGLKDSVTNAVNLGEELNKTAVVFRGPGAKAVTDWSKTTTKSFGISRKESLASANTLGNMLVPLGVGRAEAAEMCAEDDRAGRRHGVVQQRQPGGDARRHQVRPGRGDRAARRSSASASTTPA